MIYTLSDKLTFGKYKGWLISDVLKEAGGKGYLRWAVKHVSFFVIDENLTRMIGSPKKLQVDPEPRHTLLTEDELDDKMKFIFS